MESTTHKQLAQSATAKGGQLNAKAAMYSRELDSVGEEDYDKKNSLKGKILSLQSQSANFSAEASEHRSDALSAEIKENDAKFKEIEKEAEEVQKQENKQQQKLEKELEEKATKGANEKGVKDSKLDNDFGEELLFLNEDRDFSPVATEDVVDFTIANPVQKNEAQAAIDPAKPNEEEKLIKGAGAAATGT